jgi:hypothetical protein
VKEELPKAQINQSMLSLIENENYFDLPSIIAKEEGDEYEGS